jgi:subtilisin-like proprotein convertase family protein
VERELNFAMTVRDNALGGGQVASDLVNVFVSRDAGPFIVTSQSTSNVITAGSIENITWDVANTFLAPINAQMVDIFLSIDGGLTFPITLAEGVDNDGAHDVVVPGVASTEARVMVKASENIFFAVNAADFSIEESEIVLNFTDVSYEVCQPDTLDVPFTYETYLGFAEEVTFSVDNPPTGLDVSFSPATAITGDTPVTLTFSNTQNVAVGSYPIKVLATSLSNSKEVTVELKVYDSSFTEIVLLSPTDGFLDAPKSTSLEWEEQFNATSYEIEVASDDAFTNIIENAEVLSNSYTPTGLDSDTSYFWRVKPENSCAEGVYGVPFGFTTVEFNCISNSASGLPQNISSIGTPTVVSKVAFLEDMPLAGINVSLELDHSYLEDLTVTLTSPLGTIVTLFDNVCGDLKDVNAVFDDSASSFVCSGTPGIEGTVRPSGSLASFIGESIKGEWVLTISDNTPADGGALKAFSLEVCVEGSFRPDADGDGVFDDGPDLCLGTPSGTPVDSFGCPVYLFPNDAFSIRLQSEACRSSNDGSITIEANQELEYTVQITGNGLNTSGDFTTIYNVSDLSAGTYSICINGADGTIVYEERCFDVVIAEPEALGVSSLVSLQSGIVELDMTGAALYNIELNGVLTQTEDEKIALNLKRGVNILKVSTNLACQGTYEEQLFVSDGPVAYPNPFLDSINISFGARVTMISAFVFSTDGRIVHNKEYQVNGAEMELDLSNLPSGMYHLKLEGENVKKTIKLLKR